MGLTLVAPVPLKPMSSIYTPRPAYRNDNGCIILLAIQKRFPAFLQCQTLFFSVTVVITIRIIGPYSMLHGWYCAHLPHLLLKKSCAMKSHPPRNKPHPPRWTILCQISLSILRRPSLKKWMLSKCINERGENFRIHGRIGQSKFLHINGG